MSRLLVHMHHLLMGLIAGAFATFMLLGVGTFFASAALAHASYVSSDPAAGAVLPTAPTQVTVHFAENVVPQGKNGIPSSLTVWHAAGAKNIYSFDEEAKQVSPENGTQFPLSDAKTMTISMQGDGDGIYAVEWHTVSADDGDPDSGIFYFGVGKGNVLGNVASPASTTASSTSSGTPVWVPILVGVLALLIGGGIGVGLGRRMTAAGKTGGSSGMSAAPDKKPVEKS